jgi:hypothetical protein
MQFLTMIHILCMKLQFHKLHGIMCYQKLSLVLHGDQKQFCYWMVIKNLFHSNVATVTMLHP